MNYLKSLRQARGRDVSTYIEVRTTGVTLRGETQLISFIISNSFIAIWSSLVNLTLTLQAQIEIRFFKQPNVYFKSEDQNQSKSREQDSVVCKLIKTKEADVPLALIVFASKGITYLV